MYSFQVFLYHQLLNFSMKNGFTNNHSSNCWSFCNFTLFSVWKCAMWNRKTILNTQWCQRQNKMETNTSQLTANDSIQVGLWLFYICRDFIVFSIFGKNGSWTLYFLFLAFSQVLKYAIIWSSSILNLKRLLRWFWKTADFKEADFEA